MSAGSKLDEALTNLLRASGIVGGMVVKQKIFRVPLLEATEKVEAAGRAMREVLNEQARKG